jgi:KDO2-lipid IV(A) lauroyltransferase
MKNYIERLTLGFAAGLLRMLPKGVAAFVGRCVGILGYYIVPERRSTALRNLNAAYGQDKTQREKKRIARKSFEHLGRNVIEFFLIPSLDERILDDTVSFSGEHNLDAALSEGRGAFLLSAHLGNWELFGVALAMRGYPAAVITKISRSEAVNRMWMGYRESAGIRILKGRGLLRDTMKHLESGGVVGFVLDQNARRREGVFVRFFGREACTLKSLAILARRTGAPVVPGYIYRQENRHHVVIEEALQNETSEDMDGDILRWTQSYMAWTERVIRFHPEQWTWLHDRWKTRPKKGPESRVQGSEGENN